MNQTISAHQFEAAYDTYSGAVFRLAMVYLGQQADAEDVTQETFLRLLYRAPIFADQTHEKRWLLQVTANLCRDQLRAAWEEDVAFAEDRAYTLCTLIGTVPLFCEAELPEGWQILYPIGQK